MESGIATFNLRVYGLLIHANKVLITDEYRGGMLMTKFPGGGLEKGEGIKACLQREFDEELGINIVVKKLFYVNDFFQRSAFKSTDQLISFYYTVLTDQLQAIPHPQDKNSLKEGEQGFRWVRIADLQPAEFTFPVDKKVVELLLENKRQ